MKRTIFLVALFLGLGLGASAQVEYGIKVGLNYNTSGTDLKEASNTIESLKKGGGNKAGFHAGGFLRFKLPIFGIYLQPELQYNRISDSYEVTYDDQGTVESEEYKAATNRLEVPVLVGKKFWSLLRFYTGPVFAMNLSEDVKWSDVSNEESDLWSTALQIGAGVDIGRLMIDARYELPLNKKITELELPTSVGDFMEYESQANMFLISLAYRF